MTIRGPVAGLSLAAALLSGCAAPEKMIGANWAGPPETAAGQEFTPEAAVDKGIAGYALLLCVVGDNQTLSQCRVLHEDPAGWGFAEAALRTRSGMKIRERQGEPYAPLGGEYVTLPVVFCPSGQVATCHPQMREAFMRFKASLQPVSDLMAAGDCQGAVQAATALKSPYLVQIVREECRTRAPQGGPVG